MRRRGPPRRYLVSPPFSVLEAVPSDAAEQLGVCAATVYRLAVDSRILEAMVDGVPPPTGTLITEPPRPALAAFVQ